MGGSLTRSSSSFVLLTLALAAAAEAGEPARVADAGLAAAPVIKVGLGVSRRVRIAGVKAASVGNADVLAAKVVGGGQVELIGIGLGKSALTVWAGESGRYEFTVSVVHDAGVGLAADFRRLLGDVEGVMVRQVGGRIVIDGTTYTAEDADRVATVTAQHGDLVANLTSAGSAALRSRAERIDAALARAGFPATHVVFVAGGFLLDGVVPSEADRTLAEAVVRAALDEEKSAR